MRKIRTAKAHVAAQQEHRNAKLSDRNARWRLLENKGQFSACDVSLTKPSLSSGKSEDDETPQSGFLEVDDNVTSLGLRLLVPPKTFWDCGYSSHRRPFGTAVTRPTEDLLGLRLLVPPTTFW